MTLIQSAQPRNVSFENIKSDAATTTPYWRMVAALGITQAKVEIRHKFRPLPLLGLFFFPLVIYLLYAFNDDFLGSEANRRALALAYVPVSLAMTGMLTMSSAIMADQDDGTLLRAKVLPGGIPAYLMGKLVSLSTTGLLGSLLVLVATQAAIGDVFPSSATGWFGFIALVILALASTTPIGIVLGGLARNVLMSLPVTLAGFGLVAISGIFYPLDNLPGTIQTIARAFPIYGLGELARVILAPGATVAEVQELIVDQPLIIVTPIMWAIVGLALCPFALRLMSRRQSGSRLTSIQSRRLNRGY